MTWTLLSRSIAPAAARLLADPLHVTLHRDFLHGHDLALLDHDETRPVGRTMILARVGEGRRDAPRVPLLEGLQRLLHALAREVRARALDGFGGHERPQPAAHVRRGVRVVGMVLRVP